MWKLIRSSLCHSFRSTLYGPTTQFVRCIQTNSAPPPPPDMFVDERPAPDGPDEEQIDLSARILEKALSHVSERGWSEESLRAGTSALGLPEHLVPAFFPRGGIHLVCYFYEESNFKMSEQIRFWKEFQDTGVVNAKLDVSLFHGAPPKVKDTYELFRNALRYRLHLILPVLSKWNQAMGLLALPQNADLSLPLFRQLLDELAEGAGHVAVDFSWYARRLSLGAVYSSTELFMLQDTSLHHEETWKYLNRRLKDLVLFDNSYNSLVKCSTIGGQIASASPTFLKNMLGFQ